MNREIDGGASSIFSQNSVIAHFGLGKATKIDKITVYWTGGNIQTINTAAINQLLNITEIPGKKSSYFFIYLFIALAVAVAAVAFFKRRNKASVTKDPQV